MNVMKCIIMTLLVLAVPLTAAAQYQVPHGQICAGSGRADGSHILRCTAGQLSIGEWGGAYVHKAGFWYMAWVTSTVDVAVTSFTAEYAGGAVVLYWTAMADEAFDGFNVYRADGTGEDFIRINAELIPPESDCSYMDSDVVPGKTYIYRVGAAEGEKEFLSGDLTVTLPPARLMLYQNYPNPFNPATVIKCYLPSEEEVTLEIFDVGGRRVAVLADRVKLKGFQSFSWNGRDSAGNFSGSGVYFYRLTAGKESISRKMVLLR